MGVDSTAPEYDQYVESWIDMRAVREGERAVKAAGTRFLPALGGQADDAEGRKRYAAYKNRATFYNATGRTVDGMSGMIFRKPPQVEKPTKLNDFVEDVTLSGLSIQEFAESVVEEVLSLGRVGVLVDMPTGSEEARTQAEAERMNIRPFWSMYKAENITNWKVEQVGNKSMLTQVRLYEVTEEAGEDEFDVNEVPQYRVLDLVSVSVSEDSESKRLAYRQRLYRQTEDKKQWVQFGEDIFPKMNGVPLDYIPFVFFGTRDTTPRVDRPPLLDLADVNLSHYRSSADLEHGAHFTALPTPYMFGISNNDDPPSELGPDTLWESENENASAGLLEFTGAGLKALESRIEKKEGQMASLGARMLAPEKRQAESAETASIHRSGEISVLASLAMAVSGGLSRALEIARDWFNVGGTVSIELNRDYLPNDLSPQQLTALIQAVQSGNMSKESFFYNLQRGDLIPDGKTFEEEQEQVDNDIPLAGRGLPDDESGDGDEEDEDDS